MILAYTDGPSVKNSAGRYACSRKYDTLEWAKEQCNNDINCKWLHDYGCDDKNWRFCSKGDIQGYTGVGGCSKIKPGKNGEFKIFNMSYFRCDI